MEHLKIFNNSKHPLPAYQTAGSAGIDLVANLDQPITIQPLGRAIISTGLFMAIPQGMEGQVRPRSGLATKKGVTVINSPGTIDSDYRGEVMVGLVNLSNEPYTVNDGDRVAQLVISKFEALSIQQVDSLEETARGHGGFGHTGV
jgi:dUTP pyrophosphatase